jgi:hypothetical protein
MHLKSILNRVERHKCFVYKQVRFVDGLVEPELEVEIEKSKRTGIIVDDRPRGRRIRRPKGQA